MGSLVLVLPAFFGFLIHLGAVRGQTRQVVLPIRLAEVVITHRVNEDHQHSPGDEEQSYRRQWIQRDTDLQSLIANGQPGNSAAQWILRQVFL